MTRAQGSILEIKHSYRKRVALRGALIVWLMFGAAAIAAADVYWVGWDSTDWADPNNWGNGYPTNSGAGNTIINPAANPCVVSNAGNYTRDGIYISIGVGLSIVSGGQLSTPTTFVTGVWGNSLPVEVSGGELNIGGYLNLGPGGYDGDIDISGGTVTAGALSITTTGGAGMNISGTGRFVTDISQLGNVNYWVGDKTIRANGGAAGWSIKVDTNAIFNKVVLTAVNVPPPITRYWNGNVSQAWTNPNNFQSSGDNLPGVPLPGDDVLLESWAARTPLINAGGNAALNAIYQSKDMTIASGGALNTTYFKLGWDASATLSVGGGSLSAGNHFDVGGYHGGTAMMNISGGAITVGTLFLNANGSTNITVGGSQVHLTAGTLAGSALSIAETHPTVLNLAGGTLVLPNSQLDNVRFWMNDGAISAYGLADSTNRFNIDQTTMPGSLVITAIYPGFDMPAFPQWNPELIINLPPGLDQSMPLVPPGLGVATNADYSFGSAVATNGDVYFTEFGNMRIQKFSVASRTLTTVVDNRPGLFGVAVDNAGNLFYAQDFGVGAGKVVWRKPGGAEQDIITNVTAPKQVAVDAAGNVYVVQEWGGIYKWTKSTGTATMLMQTPPVLEGVAVGPDGRIYFCTYARGGGTGTMLTQGGVWVRETNGVTRPIAGGFGRGRGLALAPNGDLYAAAEANVWDNGNSGLLVKIATNGVMTRVVSGIDYPQFPSAGGDGKVYCTLARDNKLVVYDPQNSFAPQTVTTPGITLSAEGATWQETSGGNYPFSLHLTNTNNPADAMTIHGYLKINPGAGKVSMWWNVPVTNLNISLVQLTNSAGNTNSGSFNLPAASVDWSYGQVNLSVIPLREHKRCRWPMTNPGNGALEAPAPDFGEKPASYLVYVNLFSPPSLKIQRWTGNQVRVSWPTSAAGFTLQRSTAVNTGYTSPGLTIRSEGSENVAYDNAGTSRQFYRLIK